MRRPTRRARLLTLGFGLVVGVLAVLVLPAAPASAHASLLNSDPAAGTVVGSLPSVVTLTFSQAVQPVVSQTQVIAPDGSRALGGRMSAATAAKVRIPLRPGGPTGTYLVSYRVISEDGHPVTGILTFSVRAASAIPPLPSSANAPAVSRNMRIIMGVARYLAVAGLVLLVGAVLFLVRLWPPGPPRGGLTRLVLIGLGLLAVGTLAELYLQAPYGAGGGPFGVTWDSLHQVLSSRFGVAHLARLGVLAALVAPLARVIAGRATHMERALLAVLALVGLATWPLAGHPGTSSVPALTIAADAAHLGAVAVWVGGLVVLLGFLLRRGSGAELAAVLPVWSRWAQWAVLVLVLGGVTEAVVEVRGFGRLFSTEYGRLVLLKVAILAAVLAVAAYSRRTVQQRFTVVVPQAVAVPVLAAAPAAVGRSADAVAADAVAADDPPTTGRPAEDGLASTPADGNDRAAERPPALRRLRLAVLVEIAGALVVIGVAMALVQAAPAVSTQGVAAVQLANPGTVGGFLHVGMLEGPTCMLQVHFSPGRTGINHVQLYAYNRAGAPLNVLAWQGTAQLPGRKTGPLDIPLTRINSNHATGQVAIPATGTWQLRFTLQIAGARPVSVTGTLPIR